MNLIYTYASLSSDKEATAKIVLAKAKELNIPIICRNRKGLDLCGFEYREGVSILGERLRLNLR